jgi:hypothetical protein
LFSYEYDTSRHKPTLFTSVNQKEYELPRRIEGYYCCDCYDSVGVYYIEDEPDNFSSSEFEYKLIEAARIIKKGETYKEVIDGVEGKLLECLTVGPADVEVVKGIIRCIDELSGIYNWELDKLKDAITELIRMNEEARI